MLLSCKRETEVHKDSAKKRHALTDLLTFYVNMQLTDNLQPNGVIVRPTTIVK